MIYTLNTIVVMGYSFLLFPPDTIIAVISNVSLLYHGYNALGSVYLAKQCQIWRPR